MATLTTGCERYRKALCGPKGLRLQMPKGMEVGKLGRIPSETRLGCPGCNTVIDRDTLEALANGREGRCNSCHRQLTVPDELLRRLAELAEGSASSPELHLASRMPCPACRGDLLPLLFEASSLELDRCKDCFGLWFDRKELRLLITSPDLHSQVFEGPGRQTSHSEDAQRCCARCEGATMTARHLKDVEIDECPSCQGVWLDAGELTQLIRLHESRGSKDAEQDHPKPPRKPLLGTLAKALKGLIPSAGST